MPQIQRVRKAVFPAAGLGSRFLPATKAQPKEMLPLVDDPQVRAELLARLEQARGAAAAEAMRVALEVEEARWLTTRPWVPFEFFLVMDPSDR